jgi:hypothetical protein
MKLPTIVNVSQFGAADEVEMLTRLGFRVLDLSFEEIVASPHSTVDGRLFESSGMLRVSRLGGEQYAAAYSGLLKRGIQLRNSPEVYNVLSEFSLHYPLIQQVSPKAIVLPSDAPASEIVADAMANGLGKSVFIKTELKSLKADSLIQQISIESVERCQTALKKAFGGFKNYVIKEVIPLEPSDHRAVVFGTHIVGFDAGPLAANGDITASRPFEFVNDVVSSLLRRGLCGDYVIDIARRIDTGNYVVVEMKDVQFTQLKQPQFIWKRIARQCSFE